MIKIYASKGVEARLLPILAEFRCRAFMSYPIKGVTRKQRKTKLFKVVNFPIQ